MKLFKRSLTFRRIFILLGGAFTVWMGVDMLYNSCLPTRGGCVHTETRQPVILVVGIIWSIAYIWLKDLYYDIYPLERFKPHKIHDFKYVNVDLIKHDDYEWINELKQKQKKEQLIAYSKHGSFSARAKVKKLNLTKYFIDFIDYEEINKHHGKSK